MKCTSSMITVFLFVFLFKESLSLECYACSSQLNLKNGMESECDYFSSYDRSKIMECPFPNVCAKYYVEHDGVKWVHRSCRTFDVCSKVATLYNNNRDALIECTTCSDRNLCNSSQSVKIITSAIICGLAFLVILK